LLLCFCAHVIVPGRILQKLAGRAYNFHPGSPEFPGRTPSDMAVYQGAREFGATAHVMTANVDEGPIVAVKRFRAPEGCTSAQLNALSVKSEPSAFPEFGSSNPQGPPFARPTRRPLGFDQERQAKSTRGTLFVGTPFRGRISTANSILRRKRAALQDGDSRRPILDHHHFPRPAASDP
jgi:hypothetical protein